MSHVFNGAAKVAVGLASLIAGSGLVLGALTLDAIPGLVILGAGIASGVVYIWMAPRKSHVQLVEDMLEDETKAHDKTREKLRILKDAMADAGLRIHNLEDESASHGHENKSS